MSLGPRMVPERLPDVVRNDPKLSGECSVYDALSGATSLSGAVVYHSCKWHANYSGMRRDGEADFIVAHPDWGILSLEVKGGRIAFDAGTDKFTSMDRFGEKHPITNPFHQAAKSKRVVVDYLRDNWLGPGRMPLINARHGVIFPHSEAAGRLNSLPAYAPAEIVACSEHMVKLGSRVAQMMIYELDDQSRDIKPFGHIGIETLAGFRGKDTDLGPLPATQVSTVDQRIVQLTEDQNRYLEFMQRQKVAVLEGGAGTGKTMLALEQARRWSKNDKNVLLLCFNSPLAGALAGVLADTTVGVSTFHDFCQRTAQASGYDMAAERRSYPRSWVDRLPDRLEDVALLGPDKRYDAIIIDETQDFQAKWVEALQEFTVPGGYFWCFRDDAQNVQFGEELLNVIDVQPFALHENVRNAKPVFLVSQRFRVGPRQTCLGPEGPKVEYVDARGVDPTKAVTKAVNGLLTADRISPNDVAVLLEHADVAKTVSASLSKRAPVPADNAWKPGLVVDTVRRFKGLDRPVVVLETRGLDSALDYVGFTRARGRLIVVETG